MKLHVTPPAGKRRLVSHGLLALCTVLSTSSLWAQKVKPIDDPVISVDEKVLELEKISVTTAIGTITRPPRPWRPKSPWT